MKEGTIAGAIAGVVAESIFLVIGLVLFALGIMAIIIVLDGDPNSYFAQMTAAIGGVPLICSVLFLWAEIPDFRDSIKEYKFIKAKDNQ